MIEFKLDAVDELFALSSDLEAITYLQGLLNPDISGCSLYEPKLNFAHRHAQTRLWDKQLETILKLREILIEETLSENLPKSNT